MFIKKRSYILADIEEKEMALQVVKDPKMPARTDDER
jgi:hypothetical protein